MHHSNYAWHELMSVCVCEFVSVWLRDSIYEFVSYVCEFLSVYDLVSVCL